MFEVVEKALAFFRKSTLHVTKERVTMIAAPQGWSQGTGSTRAVSAGVA
jgi:hypothetical protein